MIKLMKNEDHYRRELEVRDELLGADRVRSSKNRICVDLLCLAWLPIEITTLQINRGTRKATSDELQWPTRLQRRLRRGSRWATDAARWGFPDFKFGIVMPAAHRNLMTAMLQERMDVPEVVKVFKNLAQCLRLVHERGHIHGDFKPLNCVRMKDGSWRLIDLDAAVKVSTESAPSYVGVKTENSSAFAPPEMTVRLDGGRVALKDSSNRDLLIAQGDGMLPAHPTYDIWSFGVTLYRALRWAPLFEADNTDNLFEQAELARLHDWNTGELSGAIDAVQGKLWPKEEEGQEEEENHQQRIAAVQATDLLAWLLQPKSEDRPQSFEQVLNHVFFAGEGPGTSWRMSTLHVLVARNDANFLVPSGDEWQLLSQQHLLEKTPLHMAVTGLNESTVRRILASAERNQAKSTGRRTLSNPPVPVRRTSSMGSVQVANSMILRSREPNSLLYKCVNARDGRQNTPLHALLNMVEQGFVSPSDIDTSLRIVETLVDLTDPTIQDASGRAVGDVAKASSNKTIRDIVARQISQKRCVLFHETVLSEQEVVEPWGLAEVALQSWLRNKAGEKNKGSLKSLLDGMGSIDGLTVLNEWIDVGFAGKKTNFGRLVESRIKKQLNDTSVKTVAVAELSKLLGVLPKGKFVQPGVFQAGGLSYYKAILHSCEKRSLLTDYVWIKMVGEGAFGRAHLCRCVKERECAVCDFLTVHYAAPSEIGIAARSV